MNKLFFTLLITSIYCSHAYSGDNDSLPNYYQILVDGSTAYQEENYEKSLEYLNQISRNDTNYETALIIKIAAHMLLDQYDEAIITTEKGIALPIDDVSGFYVSKGSLLEDLEKYKEAIAVYEEGEKNTPIITSFHTKLELVILKWKTLKKQ